MKKPIKDWDELERPRERLINFGAESLSDSELLAIILRTGGKGKSAVELARELLEMYGSFRGFEDVSVKELSSHPFVGMTKAVEIKACLEIGKRFLKERKEKVRLKNKSDVLRLCETHLMPYLRDQRKEVLMVIFLNSKNEVTGIHRVSVGTLDTLLVHPREVLKEAIKESAAGIIAVHNHPSGDPAPSPHDVKVTKKLMDACKVVGIRFIDHVIIGDNSLFSFYEENLIDE